MIETATEKMVREVLEWAEWTKLRMDRAWTDQPKSLYGISLDDNMYVRAPNLAHSVNDHIKWIWPRLDDAQYLEMLTEFMWTQDRYASVEQWAYALLIRVHRIIRKDQ